MGADAVRGSVDGGRHQSEHPWLTPWGIMPKLDPCDTDSLAEQIQRALPATKVVKSFVTQEQATVVDPAAVGGAEGLSRTNRASHHPHIPPCRVDACRMCRCPSSG